MNSDTDELIRKLSRRQWTASLLVAVLALSFVLFIAAERQNAEILDLAGRQTLLLLQLSTLLSVGLLAFGWFRISRPLVRRLAGDAAARAQAERELKLSEERFKAFSGSSSDWFWETDAEHRFKWFQDIERMQQPLRQDRLLGRTRLELRAEAEHAAVEKWAAFQADLDARRPFREFEYQLRDGEYGLRWVSVSGQPFFDSDGNFLGYRGTARHVQEQKEIEASYLRLQLAIEQSPVSIMITDAQTHILYVNAHFSMVSGYSAHETLGRTPKMLWSGEMPDSVFVAMRRALEEGNVWRGEMCNRRKNGDLYWESQSVSPVYDHFGKTTHFIAVSEDISAKKQIERREHSRNRILEAIANGMQLTDVLQSMLTMAEAELPGGICTIQRLDPTQGRLYCACSSALSAAFTEAIEALDIGHAVGSCGMAAFTASRVVVPDIASHPLWLAYQGLAAAEGLQACWSQPIMSSGGRVLGTLTSYYRSPRSPGADEIQVVELVASLAGICLERDEAEQSLRRQEAEARKLLVENQTILSNAMVGIVYLKQRRVVSCNRRLEQIFGYEPGELIGESAERFYDTAETYAAIGAEAYRVVAESRNYNVELTLKHKDGSLFRGALNGCAIDPAQPQEGSIWVYADISERYSAERQAHKLLQAVEQCPVSIVITDREGLIEYVNPRFTRVTGYSAREALGQNPRILQSGEMPREVFLDLWQTLLDGKEWRGILHNRRKNGELFWEEASISPILDEQGDTTHFLAVKEDITQRKRIEDELEQHRAHLEELVEQRTAELSAALEAAKVADQAKDAFLAHIGHELRTPLNAVLGLAQLARRMSTDPRQQDYLDKAASAGTTLAGVIDDLLDLSKISAGRMDLEKTTFSLRGLIQRCKSVMAHRADEKGLILIERIEPDVPDVLVGDPLRIEQILLNLLSNAIKFTPAGHIELSIGVAARTEQYLCLGIRIEDTGIGLSAASMARLFRPFAQADASINRRFGGTGLGLALCKRLAEMMAGDIAVTSQEGVGTTFRVRLWVGLGAATAPTSAGRTVGKQRLPARYRNAQVLVVDDQPLNREIVEALLAEVGIGVRSAGNGQEALDILKTAGPDAYDLVLMDIQMPVLDGIAATGEIRRWPGFATLPIIAMTAHTMQHEKEISTAAGMNEHIGKPFETEHFFQVLARWIPVHKHELPLASAAPIADPLPATGLAALRSIDTAAALARFVGNEPRYRHWLTEFVVEAPGYAAQIRQTLAAGNTEAARQTTHAIKGRVGMLGMTELYPLASALEAALMQGRESTDLLDELQARIALSCAEIQAGLGPPQPVPAPTAAGHAPHGPLPQAVAGILAMLKCADGACAEAIERCLAELKDDDWAPQLQKALAQVRKFDFDAAATLLAPDEGERDKETHGKDHLAGGR